MTSSSRVACAFLSFSLATTGAMAVEPTAQDYATARTLYKEGKDLRAAGDLHGAYEKLKAAHALGHTPLTGIELARTEVQLGLIVEAREVCLGVARMPVESDETDRSAEARESAAKLAVELEPRMSSLRIRIQGPADAIVTVDGVNVPPAALDQARKVDPGHHVVNAHVEDGATVSATVDVAEGQEGAVDLAPPPAPHDTLPKKKTQPVSEQRHSRLGAITVSGIVVTGAGLFLGAVGGIYAMGKASSLTCNDNHECLPDQWQAINDARAAATVSTVGFSIAGAGVVLLVVGLATHTASKESTQGLRVRPAIGLGQIGVDGVF